jgi:hypothetical protein
VISAGGNSQVLTGGQTHVGPGGASGGNYGTGFGQYNHAWSHNRAHNVGFQNQPSYAPQPAFYGGASPFGNARAMFRPYR